MLRTLAATPVPSPDALACAAWLDGRSDECASAAVETALAADPVLALALLALRSCAPEPVPARELARVRSLREPPGRDWRALLRAWTPARAALALACCASVIGVGLGDTLAQAQLRREQAALAQFAFGDDPFQEADR
ncbi:MAG: hypothetical protein AMXMBFR25_05570 [Lysobacterales bacterium]